MENANEMLQQFKVAIDAIVNRLDAQDELIKAQDTVVKSLQSLIFDEVVNPAQKAIEEFEYNKGLEGFTERNGALAGYNEKLRPIEGEEFDVYKTAYDGFNSIPEEQRPEEAAYVSDFVANVDAQLEDIKKALGISPEDNVTIEEKDDKTVVEVRDGETEEVVDEIVITDEEGVTSDPDELARYEEELLQYK